MAFNNFCYLELCLPFCLAEQHLCKFYKRYPEEQFCEIILNLDLWFRRCRLNDFLSGALVALVFSRADPFMQFK